MINKDLFKLLIKFHEISDDINNSNENLTYSVFITHNFKSHFRYYNHELDYANTDTKIDILKNFDFIITNKYTRSINETLGPVVANLVESEKINIFERYSDVYNSYCQNITLLGIDMPLKQRLLFLYPHRFSERLACLGEDTVIDEFNLESTCACNCKIGNNLEDILKEDKFTHYDGHLDEYNNFIDSISINNTLHTILLEGLLSDYILRRLGG